MKKNTKTILSVILAVVSIVYVLPVLAVVINSFKQNTFVKTDTFALPTGEMSAGFDNFIKGMTFGNYPFVNSVLYSVMITLLSTFLILLCTSMAAWYIARVDSAFCKAIYFLCVFSMVVPFQMVMFPLSKTADKLQLNTPWTIPIVYIGIGAGFDYIAGNIERAPEWMQKNNLEWIYRLMQDPVRLLGRYMKTNSKFIWHAVIRGK